MILKLIRNSETITAVFDDGTVIVSEGLTMKQADEVMANKDNEELVKTLLATTAYSEEDQKTIETHRKVAERTTKKSSILTYRGDSVIWSTVSQHTMPTKFVERILEAEEKKDEKKLESYKNFWTWACLNPDPAARHNTFWFLDRWGMELTQSGLIIGYRNAKEKSKASKSVTHSYTTEEVVLIKSTHAGIVKRKLDTTKLYLSRYTSGKFYATKTPDVNHKSMTLQQAYDLVSAKESTAQAVYTDVHSGTTTIIIGQPVTMDRAKCDANQDNSCSRGLHIGAKGWLKSGYFGGVGLVCLINPADVVAIPTIDSYGKMRTARYLPIAEAKYDASGNVFSAVTDGFEDGFITNMAAEYKEQGADGNYRIVMDIKKQREAGIGKNIEQIMQATKARTKNV